VTKKTSFVRKSAAPSGYSSVLTDVAHLLEAARRASVRTTNAIMTATYWEIGRRIVEFEQGGKQRAAYGEELLQRLSDDLSARFGRGFSIRNLRTFRMFYLRRPIRQTLSAEFKEITSPESTAIIQTPSGLFEGVRQSEKSKTLSGQSQADILQTLSTKLSISDLAKQFPLPWSHYVLLLSIKKPEARAFYEAEALRGGWSVRQLDRQISSQFYERALLSRNKAAMLKKGSKSLPEDALTPEEEIKDPFVLEFLNLKDEYSENDLEEALILQLEHFLLELGGDFAFVGRQRRLRIGDEWYRVDLLFFHRKLRCLVIIDLKLGKFTHADAGQMHLYLNYAREHWTNDGENPPVGLILCAQKDHAVAHYALEGLSNKILASEYRTTLPDEKILATELEKTRKQFEKRAPARFGEKDRK
jgi:predicted nuclease of restriction endonuclease-like (RecB) superfamily